MTLLHIWSTSIVEECCLLEIDWKLWLNICIKGLNMHQILVQNFILNSERMNGFVSCYEYLLYIVVRAAHYDVNECCQHP